MGPYASSQDQNFLGDSFQSHNVGMPYCNLNILADSEYVCHIGLRIQKNVKLKSKNCFTNLPEPPLEARELEYVYNALGGATLCHRAPKVDPPLRCLLLFPRMIEGLHKHIISSQAKTLQRTVK